MINKRYTLKSLLLPLLACLFLAGTTGCSNEVMPEEGGEMPDNGGTTSFSVGIRGVVTDSPIKNGVYQDDYVGSIRILAFNAEGAQSYNQLFKQTAEPDNNVLAWESETNDEITINLQEINLESGNYTFCFIANEGGHTLNATTTLTGRLEDSENLITRNDLEALKIEYADPSEDKHILMTVKEEISITQGTNIMRNITLVRTLSKVIFTITDETGLYTLPQNISLTGKVPSEIDLFSSNTNMFDPTDNLDTKTISLAGLNSGIYLPERLLSETANNVDNALSLEGSATNSTVGDKSFSIAIGPSDETGANEYSIFRNYTYFISAILKSSPVTPSFEVVVNAWGEKEMDVPPFE